MQYSSNVGIHNTCRTRSNPAAERWLFSFLSFFYFLSLCLYRIGLNRDVLLDVAFAVLNAPCTADSFLYRHILKSFFQSCRRTIWLQREGKKERERCLSPQEMNQFVSVNPHTPPQKKPNNLAMAAAAAPL